MYRGKYGFFDFFQSMTGIPEPVCALCMTHPNQKSQQNTCQHTNIYGFILFMRLNLCTKTQFYAVPGISAEGHNNARNMLIE